MELKDKVAIITGVAGGIGQTTADLFAKEGATLVLVDINKQALDALVEKIGPSAQTLSFAIDVSNEQQVQNVVQSTLKKFGKIDILVNGAAICKMIPILDIEVVEWYYGGQLAQCLSVLSGGISPYEGKEIRQNYQHCLGGRQNRGPRRWRTLLGK